MDGDDGDISEGELGDVVIGGIIMGGNALLWIGRSLADP